VVWCSKCGPVRHIGKVLGPAKALAHHPRVLWGDLRFEQSVSKWNKLNPDLKALAVMHRSSRGALTGVSRHLDTDRRFSKRGLFRERVYAVSASIT
jgi:hypothetical protein